MMGQFTRYRVERYVADQAVPRKAAHTILVVEDDKQPDSEPFCSNDEELDANELAIDNDDG